MAITQTGAMYKSLLFDNTSSRSYGVYITGEAVYNAPERAVDMISIPGRNGSFALDQGRFENIEVSYPAGIFADNEADFAQAVSDFRNFLCSKKGYCRLSDEYNPSEYRMAVYKSGLEVDPAQLRAGEFTITFDCKPQRWLTSGETATTVANNGTMTNPTLFESSPLLEVTGYGTIGFNGYEIELDSAPFGDIAIERESAVSPTVSGDTISWSKTVSDIDSFANSSDEVECGDVTFVIYLNYDGYNLANVPQDMEVTSVFVPVGDGTMRHVGYRITYTASSTDTGAIGSADDFFEIAKSIDVKLKSNVVETMTITYRGSVDATTSDLSIIFEAEINSQYEELITYSNQRFEIEAVTVHSTKSYLGNPTYIDCDLGEAYRIDNGVATSLNAYIDLGSDLPTLASGTNTFTKSNTITQLKVMPRWWRV